MTVMFDLLENKEKHCEFDGVETVLKEDGRYCCVPVTHKVTLGEIVDLLDKAMLGFIVKSNAENGYYEQAHKIVNMTMSVVTAYTVIMRSRMSYLFAQKQITEIKKRTRDSLHFICMLVFPMGFGLAGIAKNFVPWFFGQVVIKLVDYYYKKYNLGPIDMQLAN